MKTLSTAAFAALLFFSTAAMSMGIKLPVLNPTPVPAPAVPPQEIWLTPNIGSTDFLDMFTSPELWATARGKLNGMKFYIQQLLNDDPQSCPICGQNIFPNFISREAFQKMQGWGLKLAVEMGAVKPGDCEATNGINNAINLFQKLSAQGIVVEYIALDEPFASGSIDCQQSDDLTAQYIANFTQVVTGAYQQYYPGRTLRISVIAGFPLPGNPPGSDINVFLGYLTSLKNHNAIVDAIHMDNDFWAKRNLGISDAQYKADLTDIETQIKANGWHVGMLFWGHGSTKVQDYKNDVLQQIPIMTVAGGIPEHINFQSWDAITVNGQTLYTNPNNLPETDSNSHTSIVIQGLKLLGL